MLIPPQALFSMPFFANQEDLTSARTIWIWVLLTALTTAFAFSVYWRSLRTPKRSYAMDDLEHSQPTLAPPATQLPQ
jgi:hypothetical protein